MDQRRAAEALPLLRRAAKLAKRQLGGAHPHYATTLNNLAAGLEQQGLRKEAKRHMTRALKINTKAFGEEHANTKDTAANLDRLRGGKDAAFEEYAKKKDPDLGRVRDEL